MSDAVALVKAVYECFERDEIPVMLDLLGDDVEWRTPGSSAVPWAGVWRGPEQVGDCMAAIRAAAEIEEFETLEFLGCGNRVVVTGRERLRARSTGRRCEAEWIQVWTVEGRKVVRFREYSDTAALNGAF